MQRFHTHNHIAKELDKLIDLITASNSTAGVRIKVEATVIHEAALPCLAELPDRFVLDTIDLESFPNNLQHAGYCNVGQTPVREERYQLPSPTTSGNHSPRGNESPQRQGGYGADQIRSTAIPEREKGGGETRLSTRRRKTVGALSIPRINSARSSVPARSPSPPTTRQLQTGHDHFRKRRRLDTGPKLEQSTVDKLIEGIWKELHNPNSLVLDQKLPELLQKLSRADSRNAESALDATSFDITTQTCRHITESARTGRALEVIMQAHWIDSFDAQLASLAESRTDLRPSEQKKATLAKACELFNWSEKELRNRM